jgi:hypothetical protein
MRFAEFPNHRHHHHHTPRALSTNPIQVTEAISVPLKDARRHDGTSSHLCLANNGFTLARFQSSVAGTLSKIENPPM